MSERGWAASGTPENSRTAEIQPPAVAMRDSTALQSALPLLLLLPSLLFLISATSSSCSLPAISKAPARRERLSRTLERIPWLRLGTRGPGGPRARVLPVPRA